MIKERSFMFYSNVKVVMGAKNALIVDLQFSRYISIPRDVGRILLDSRELELSRFNDLEWSYDFGLEELYDVLSDMGFGRFEYDDCFKSEHEDLYRYPYTISNLIVELSTDSDIERINAFFGGMISWSAEIRLYDLDFYKEQKVEFRKFVSKCDSVDLYAQFYDELFKEEVLASIKIDNLVFCGVDLEPFEGEGWKCVNVQFDNKCCGNIRSSEFIANIPFYAESKSFNSCLYGKISIDKNGNIKNCPSMSESFGNIKDTTLAEAIEKPGFKKYWDINKDKIHVCKDCEFRYICTDCRAYIEDPDDIYSKPLKCGYNPYTGEWSEWSTNPLKQKTIDCYEMREILT